MAAAFWLQDTAPGDGAAGALDTAALRGAVHRVIERHESLRTVFQMRGGTLRQRVLDVPAIDDVLRQTDSVRGLAELVEARIAAPFDLARGPLFDAELFRVAGDRHLLLVRLHHIVGDATSIRIVLREVLESYAASRRGDANPQAAALPIQYRDFVAWQNRLDQDESHHASRRYWRETLAAPLPRTGFATVPAPSPSSPATSHGVSATAELDAAQVARVRAVAAEHGGTLFSAVVAAVYALLYRYRQHEDLVIGSTVSRRDHPMLEDQVGCYIDTLVLRGGAHGTDRAADLLTRTAGVCRGALAHRDVTFESVLDLVGDHGRQSGLTAAVADERPPLFDVLVDFVPAHAGPGGSDGPFAGGLAELSGLTVAEHSTGAQPAHYRTMFLASETPAGLAVQIVCDPRSFTVEEADLLRARFQLVWQWLAERGDRPLGDVDLNFQPVSARRRLRVVLNTG
jgi:hypothetical protein